MLRIVVEIVPHGMDRKSGESKSRQRRLAHQRQEKLARTLGTLLISNDGTGTPDSGNYDVYMRNHMGRLRKRRVEGWPRRKSFWALVHRAITVCFPDGAL